MFIHHNIMVILIILFHYQVYLFIYLIYLYVKCY